MTFRIPTHHRPGIFANQCEACRHPLLEDDPPDAQFCSRQICVTQRQMRKAAETAKGVHQKREAALKTAQRRAEPAIAQAKSRVSNGSARNIASGVAPYIDVPLQELSPKRRAEFTAHVNTIVAESFGEHPEEDGAPTPPHDDPGYAKRLEYQAPEPKILDTACIACQGDCCCLGRKNNAFLTKTTVDFIRWSKPEISPDDIVEIYLSRLPEKSVFNSCVYHGDKGCVLDRNIRADICNSFQCVYRRRLEEEYAECPGHGAVIAGIAADHTEHPEAGAKSMRLVSMTEDGDVTVHDDIPMPALPTSDQV